jgi:hypothetical protein
VLILTGHLITDSELIKTDRVRVALSEELTRIRTLNGNSIVPGPRRSASQRSGRLTC